MKTRYLILLGIAAWTPIIVATCSEPPAERRATAVTIGAGELAAIERQARVLCARRAPGRITLPDGVLECVGPTVPTTPQESAS